MDIDEYKIRHGYKELPKRFYLQGAFFFIFPVCLILGLLGRFGIIPIWLGWIIVIPYSAFWGWKGYKSYRKDK